MVGVEPAPLTKAYANPLAEDEGWLDGFGACDRTGSPATGGCDHRRLHVGARIRAAFARGGGGRANDAGRRGRRPLER